VPVQFAGPDRRVLTARVSDFLRHVEERAMISLAFLAGHLELLLVSFVARLFRRTVMDRTWRVTSLELAGR